MSDPRTSITLRENTGEKLRDLKEASNAGTWDDFFTGIVDEEDDIEVNLEDLNTVELEKTEKAQETRAMAVGVLEAMQRTGIKEDVLDLIEELRKTEMVEMNKRVVQHVLQKAKSGEALNEADRALLDMVVEIESQRDSGPDVGSVIAEGLFGETEEQTAEQTTTKRATAEDAATEDSTIEFDDSIFTGVEDAESSDLNGIDTPSSDDE
jgi:hypothetical protein